MSSSSSKQHRIYVALSWRNLTQPSIVEALGTVLICPSVAGSSGPCAAPLWREREGGGYARGLDRYYRHQGRDRRHLGGRGSHA